MDTIQGEGALSRRTSRGAPSPGFSLLIVLAILLISGAGCLGGRAAKGTLPIPPGEEEEVTTRIEDPPEIESALGSPTTEPSETAQAPAPPVADIEPESTEMEAAPAPVTVPPPTSAPPEVSAPEAPSAEPAGKRAPAPPRVPPAPDKAFTQPPTEVPAWAMGTEVLVYRIEFLGMAMGYARFTYKGKVSIHGRDAYHLNVRAWTTDFLSVIYPVNDTIDYYLDARTLAPLRQEYARSVREKDDVATYDQAKGKIVYRYKRTGEIRKQVDVLPETYDPVSAAYYFRARDLEAENRPRHVYGGRKLYEISAKIIGREKIEISGKPVDTVIIRPVITRDGKPDNKGDLRMWMTNDARHVPVRFYAKFKKIGEWTLHAELVPPREGG